MEKKPGSARSNLDANQTIKKIKNHPIAVILIFFTAVIIGLASLTDSFERLAIFFGIKKEAKSKLVIKNLSPLQVSCSFKPRRDSIIEDIEWPFLFSIFNDNDDNVTIKKLDINWEPILYRSEIMNFKFELRSSSFQTGITKSYDSEQEIIRARVDSITGMANISKEDSFYHFEYLPVTIKPKSKKILEFYLSFDVFCNDKKLVSKGTDKMFYYTSMAVGLPQDPNDRFPCGSKEIEIVITDINDKATKYMVKTLILVPGCYFSNPYK